MEAPAKLTVRVIAQKLCNYTHSLLGTGVGALMDTHPTSNMCLDIGCPHKNYNGATLLRTLGVRAKPSHLICSFFT